MRSTTLLVACVGLFVNPVGLAADKAQGFSSPGKPTAPVSVRSDGLRLAVGERGIAQVLVTTTAAVNSLNLALLPSDGLAATVAMDTVYSVPRGGELLVPIEVRAVSDGLWRLNLVATTEQSGNLRSRVFSVPIHIGSGAPITKRNGELSQTGDGEVIVRLKAQETIR